jgi:hypothetical protein
LFGGLELDHRVGDGDVGGRDRVQQDAGARAGLEDAIKGATFAGEIIRAARVAGVGKRCL